MPLSKHRAFHLTLNARINQIGARSPDSAAASEYGSGGGSSDAADRTDSEECYDYDNSNPGDDAPQPFMNYDKGCVNLLQIRKDLSL